MAPNAVAGFFFQAEDGIRDVAVTGVQTCALPILLNALRTEALLCPGHVGSAMRRLHRSNDAEFRKARNILRCEHLRVLDAQTRIMRIGHLLFRLFVGVEHGAVRSVADGMRAKLKASLESTARQTRSEER